MEFEIAADYHKYIIQATSDGLPDRGDVRGD